jgi:hypothetical protein
MALREFVLDVLDHRKLLGIHVKRSTPRFSRACNGLDMNAMSP